MQKNLTQKGSLGISTAIEKLWRELNGPLCITDPNEIENSHVFFEMLEEFDVGGDILDISRLEQRLDNRYATSVFLGHSPVVEVMTIHKAKGLEFDHVILPGLEKGTKQDDAQLLLWADYTTADKKNYLILGPIKDAESKSDPIYSYLQNQEAEKARHEMLRLFYVAVTRAKESLHLLGTVDYHANSGIKKPSKQSFLGQLWPSVEDIFNELLAKTQSIKEMAEEKKILLSSRKRKRLKQDFFVVPPSRLSCEPLESNRFHKPSEILSLPQAAGIVIHQALQYFGSHFSSATKRATSYRQALLELGVSLAQVDEAVDLVECAVNNISICSRGRWIFSNEHKEIHAEYPINYVKDGRLFSSIIDRTFVDADNVRWIIDFKTVISPVENVSAFLNSEKQTYQEQLEHYAKLMRSLDDRIIRLGLYFPLQSAWIAWEAG